MAYFAPISQEEEEKILKSLDRTPSSLQQDVEAIKAYFETQPHIPELLSDDQIKRYLIVNKCLIEKTKKKIDMYYTLRNIFTDVFDDMHPTSERMQLAAKIIYSIPLPKLTPDLCRVTVTMVKDGSNFMNADILALFAYIVNATEIRVLEDMCAGDHQIIDLRNCQSSWVTKLTFSFLKKIMIIIEKCYTSTVQGIHIVNSPAYLDTVVMLAKSLMKPKMANRIFVHTSLDTLYKEIPREILNKELGGDEKSLEELTELFNKRFEAHADFFDKRDNLRAIEELRPSKNVNDEILGFYGNFKKLDLD